MPTYAMSGVLARGYADRHSIQYEQNISSALRKEGVTTANRLRRHLGNENLPLTTAELSYEHWCSVTEELDIDTLYSAFISPCPLYLNPRFTAILSL